MIFIGLFLAFYLFVLLRQNFDARIERSTRASNYAKRPSIDSTDIVYSGASNSIGLGEIEAILEKRYPYYDSLEHSLKEKFLHRIQNFMRRKTFIIKSNEGYREMPVLVSAAAVQLTFGLNDYLLPFYRYIRIYPTEFVGDDFFKVLAGNVSGNVITVAWNQFLNGYEDGKDGSNVGLHEMSHALYFQKIVIDGEHLNRFYAGYHHLLRACKEAYQAEMAGEKNLYSSYADTDLQEFWAESIEIFFEKPDEMNIQYPSVYEYMKMLLNQDPLNPASPLLQAQSTFSQRLSKILRYSQI